MTGWLLLAGVPALIYAEVMLLKAWNRRIDDAECERFRKELEEMDSALFLGDRR